MSETVWVVVYREYDETTIVGVYHSDALEAAKIDAESHFMEQRYGNEDEPAFVPRELDTVEWHLSKQSDVWYSPKDAGFSSFAIFIERWDVKEDRLKK